MNINNGETSLMATNTQVKAETAETLYVDVNGVRFAYRSFGKKSTVPLLFLNRFRGTVDDWDPMLVNGLAQEHHVILFDNAGVGLSSGETSDNIEGMAECSISFIEALELKEIDLIGFSMGGMVAQHLTLLRPDLVRRVILAGTGAGPGEGTVSINPEVFSVAAKPINVPEDFLYLFFSSSESSQEAGKSYLNRLQLRKTDRAPLVKAETVKAQAAAIIGFATGKGSTFSRLGEIKKPVMVVNGDDDIMAPTLNSFIISQKIPNCQLIIYPNSGHGFLFEHAELFVEHSLLFLR